jgi:flagellar export protein FliJ
LSYRRSLSARERVRFATKVGALVRAEEHASELRGIRNATLIARLRALEYGLKAQEVRNLHEHLLRVGEAIDSADNDIVKAKENIDKARGELVERMRDEKAIEKLRERRWKTWLRDYYRDESRTLDDIATIRHVRRVDLEG